MTPIDPETVIMRALGPEHRRTGDVLRGLREAGWHLVSDVTVDREDDVPFRTLPEPRFGYIEPQRVTRVHARLDGEIITASGRLSQYLLARAYSGYLEHAEAELGRDFLSMLGHRLGVPGCDDVPERLRQTGHV